MGMNYSAFMAKHGNGRCINCGFLCKMAFDGRHRERAWDVERATLFNRESGDLFGLEANAIEAIPECFVGAADIGAEVNAVLARMSNKSEQKAALSAIGKKRGCREWTPWLMHTPPVWHLEHKIVYELDRRNRRLQKVMLFVASASLVASIIFGLPSVIDAIKQTPQSVTIVRPAPSPTPPAYFPSAYRHG